MLYFVLKYITFKKTYITKTCQEQTLPVFIVTGWCTPKTTKKNTISKFVWKYITFKKYIYYLVLSETNSSSWDLVINHSYHKKYEVTNFLIFYNRYINKLLPE